MWAVRCPRRREKSNEPYHLEEGEIVTREGVRSHHCAPSPSFPSDMGTRVPVAKRTTPDMNYAKESE
ncbi:hypothetical protein V6N13_040328 [Hibiscus sabdariffa]